MDQNIDRFLISIAVTTILAGAFVQLHTQLDGIRRNLDEAVKQLRIYSEGAAALQQRRLAETDPKAKKSLQLDEAELRRMITTAVTEEQQLRLRESGSHGP